jgi:uncharacterized membrane protein
MALFIKVLIIIHVFAGINALLSGALAMALKNKIANHRIAGKVYFISMNIIFVSGVILSLYRSSLFFLFISFFVYHSVLTGFRALKLKNMYRGQKPEKKDWAIEIFMGVSNFSFFAYGIYSYMNGHGADALIPTIFGLFGLRAVVKNIRRFIYTPNDPTHWLQVHVGNMMGSYIGAVTAFLVNQTPHIPIHPVILWFTPSIIIAPIIIFELRKIKSGTSGKQIKVEVV